MDMRIDRAAFELELDNAAESTAALDPEDDWRTHVSDKPKAYITKRFSFLAERKTRRAESWIDSYQHVLQRTAGADCIHAGGPK